MKFSLRRMLFAGVALLALGHFAAAAYLAVAPECHAEIHHEHQGDSEEHQCAVTALLGGGWEAAVSAPPFVTPVREPEPAGDFVWIGSWADGRLPGERHGRAPPFARA